MSPAQAEEMVEHLRQRGGTVVTVAGQAHDVRVLLLSDGTGREVPVLSLNSVRLLLAADDVSAEGVGVNR